MIFKQKPIVSCNAFSMDMIGVLGVEYTCCINIYNYVYSSLKITYVIYSLCVCVCVCVCACACVYACACTHVCMCGMYVHITLYINQFMVCIKNVCMWSIY